MARSPSAIRVAVWALLLLAGAAKAQAQSFAPLSEGSDSPSVWIESSPGRHDGPKIQSFYGEGFASDAVLADYVGTLTFGMERCDPSASTGGDRIVRVDLAKSNFEYKKVVDGILLRAAEYAWATCPQRNPNSGGSLYDLGEVDVYLPDGSHGLQASLGGFVFGDGVLGAVPGSEYHWHDVRDLAAEARQEQEAAAAQAQQAQAAAAEAAREAQAHAQWVASWDHFWATVWLVMKLAFWGAIALWIFWKREMFMRWYYMLTPHPAAHMVDRAIQTRAPLDGKAFAAVMRPVPGGKVQMQVRAAQACDLAARAAKHSEALAAAAERVKEEAVREADFLRAQDELATATVAHEQAKARLAALEARRKR